MIGETRSVSKALSMATASSQLGAESRPTGPVDSDFLSKEMDSSANDKVRSKTLREKAAAISAKLALDKQNKAAKSNVVKDAQSPNNAQTVSQEVSQVSRNTRQRKNGGALQTVRSGRNNSRASSKSPASRQEDPKSSSQPGEGESQSPLVSDSEGDVVGRILAGQEETFGSGRNKSDAPPAKKAKRNDDNLVHKQPGTSSASGLDISLELLGAIRSLNSSISDVTGIKKDFAGFASTVNSNIAQLSKRMDRQSDSESGEESSSDEGSNTQEYHKDHFISEEEDFSDSPNSAKDSPKGSSTQTEKKREVHTKVADGETNPPQPGASNSGESNMPPPPPKNSFFAKKRAQITPIKETGDPLDEDLAVILADKFWGKNIMSREQFIDTMKATLRPENIPVLQVPSLQEVLWLDLPETVRGRDKWERLTQANLMVIWRELAIIINMMGGHEGEALGFLTS